ncbi:hypothetical protein [Microlunatus parietis]|uniref:Uncharacterized protein n=1 Tax=Microlunatus parietis TaxID=682979 RepID=A0A7Y9LDN0_9ACTN|nr:hypothetical protein [Microlunatus parietis]NYE72121.1 hypothetical protein [Microlunatus parietis]
MSMLLLVRSLDDVRSAVKDVGGYLVHHRRQFGDPPQPSPLVGLWIRPELDAGLPALLPCSPSGSDSGRSADGASAQTPADEAPVGIRMSFSLAGIWTLCWMDGPLLREAQDAHEYRHRILDGFVAGVVPETAPAGAFVPVFDPADASGVVEARLSALRARHPRLVAEHWYVDDRDHGIAGPIQTPEG